MKQSIHTGKEMNDLLKSGVNKITDVVASTMGPKGKNVIIESIYGTAHSTKDGVTVAKAITLNDPVEELAASIIKQAAGKVVQQAGDGPQPLHAKILTPAGWTTMGELKIEDEICGSEGTLQKVEGIFPKGEKEIYKVHFSDGRVVECCEDHLWTVTTNYGLTKTLTVREMIDSGNICKIDSKGNKRYGFYVPKSFVDFPKQDLPINPYLLGLLLGDGSLSGSGNIELSLGKDKEYVLKNIPNDFTFKCNWVDEKNYFRVVFDSSIREYLEELGLMGTLSSTKFIPKIYLYSPIETREQLLQGLLDTDGYINNKGLFEYSTVSSQLKEDFLELCRGLGISTYDRIHNRDNDPDSYSDVSIYRITQLKGYKYGDKIVNITATGRKTEMQCIRVSNPDHLYFTDNYILTHNTTTAMVLARAIYINALKTIERDGIAPVEIKRQLENLNAELIKAIKEVAEPINTNYDKLIKVASVAANNDSFIGELIGNAFKEVGENGLVIVEESKSTETSVELTQGARFESGFISPYFINNNKLTCELENPLIFITDNKLRGVDDVLPALRLAAANDRPLVVIGDEIEAQALGLLLTNKVKAGLQVVGVKAPAHGDRRYKILEDIAILTGANLISDKKGRTLSSVTIEDFGEASKIIVDRSQTTIVEGKGNEEEIESRVAEIKVEMQDLSIGPWGVEKCKERIATLIGKVAKILVGAATEVELKEKKDRVDDALQATQAALKMGIVSGGGSVLYQLSDYCSTLDTEAGRVMSASLKEPFNQIIINAGKNPDIVLALCPEGLGYNAYTDEYVDLKEDGIIDPALVLISCLNNAISVATNLILTSATITNEDNEELRNMYSSNPLED